MNIVYLLAQVDDPTADCTGWPGCDKLQSAYNAVVAYGLFGLAIMLVAGIVGGVVAGRVGHAGGAGGAKMAAVGAFIGAGLVALSAALIRFAFNFFGS